MKDITIIRDWGPFSPGDVVEADPIRAGQLVEQGIAVLGKGTINSADVKKAVDINEAQEEQTRKRGKKK